MEGANLNVTVVHSCLPFDYTLNQSNMIPQRLNAAEIKEFIGLKKKLFGNDMFMVFDDETLNNPEFKRYETLMKKKQANLKYLHEKFGGVVN